MEPIFEEWRIANDFPKYHISDKGNIRNKKTKKELKKTSRIGVIFVNGLKGYQCLKN